MKVVSVVLFGPIKFLFIQAQCKNRDIKHDVEDGMYPTVTLIAQYFLLLVFLFQYSRSKTKLGGKLSKLVSTPTSISWQPRGKRAFYINKSGQVGEKRDVFVVLKTKRSYLQTTLTFLVLTSILPTNFPQPTVRLTLSSFCSYSLLFCTLTY